jgi:uncharacterized membrane protein YbaN (DUF454 family)
MGPLLRIGLIVAGSVFVVLGVLGMFVPLLPTTVFLLMAAWCYARSSERFHRWLLHNRFVGDYIRNYREGRGMRVREKAVTLGALWASIAYSVLALDFRLWIDLLLLAIATGVTIHILTIRTYRPERFAEPLSTPDGTRETA